MVAQPVSASTAAIDDAATGVRERVGWSEAGCGWDMAGWLLEPAGIAGAERMADGPSRSITQYVDILSRQRR
jgi:hypothetical protein